MNQAVNLFWTALCFVPVIGYWFAADALFYCILLLCISLLTLFIPLRFLQLSSQPKFYEATGVKFIRRFVQNGDYMNRLSRKNNPGYATIKNRLSAAAYLNTTNMYQRYHLICLIFFLLSMICALARSKYWFAATLALANIFYNVYPILLQQYNRARVKKLLDQ